MAIFFSAPFVSLFFSDLNCCPSQAFTSPLNPNWVGAQPNWGLIGIATPGLPAPRVLGLGDANRLVSLQVRTDDYSQLFDLNGLD